MKHKIIPPSIPPYKHVCQVGDPVLRSRAAAVDPAAIHGAEIQKVINTMVKVMRKFDCVGLSAPQIGVPLRILALEYPEKMLEESSPASREARGLSAQPLRIFVNPQLRVLDRRTVLFQEGCESISGFSATVPRYLSVEVSGMHTRIMKILFPTSIIVKIFVWYVGKGKFQWIPDFIYYFLWTFRFAGLNEKGEDVTWQASGWPARILQHEMDHLDGVLYIDSMDSKTFININWQSFNE